MQVTLNITNFRALFPDFTNVLIYTDSIITNNFDLATMYIKNETNCKINEDRLTKMLYLMTAHLLTLNVANPNSSDDITNGNVTSASIDKISVSINALQTKTAFQHFLNSTKYGVQLLSLMSLLMMGGFSVGGLPERQSFKKVGGVY